jgi:hypothetical protein
MTLVFGVGFDKIPPEAGALTAIRETPVGLHESRFMQLRHRDVKTFGIRFQSSHRRHRLIGVSLHFGGVICRALSIGLKRGRQLRWSVWVRRICFDWFIRNM